MSMKIIGIIIILGGIGAIMGNYQSKKRFMRGDYTEKDIKGYQKTLVICFAFVLIGFIMLFL